MSDTTIDPQPTDPPTNTGGGGTSTDVEETTDAKMTDPPTNTGGGGSA